MLATLPGEFSRLGMTMLLGFVVSYGFILPINAPQNMVCLGTETFNARQFAKVGIVITIVGYLLMLVRHDLLALAGLAGRSAHENLA